MLEGELNWAGGGIGGRAELEREGVIFVPTDALINKIF